MPDDGRGRRGCASRVGFDLAAMVLSVLAGVGADADAADAVSSKAGVTDVAPMKDAAGAVAGSAAPAHQATRLTRAALVGAWRLLRIEYSRNGRVAPDPFYPGESTGLIIYGDDGWMSAQIASPQPPAWPVPESRLDTGNRGRAALKAAAFDSYYAYFGTWELDAARSLVIHHVKGSLMPAELGADYSQEVALADDHMTFTGRSVRDGVETVRTKVWQRVGTTAPTR